MAFDAFLFENSLVIPPPPPLGYELVFLDMSYNTRFLGGKYEHKTEAESDRRDGSGGFFSTKEDHENRPPGFPIMEIGRMLRN